jgi:hypothetical protein
VMGSSWTGIAAKQGDEVLSLHFTSDLTMMA